MRLLPLPILCISMLALMVSPAVAQFSESISSDRPGMSYSANTVGARVLQYQIGGQFQELARNGSYAKGSSIGSVDLFGRIGVLERVELSFSLIYSHLQLKGRYSSPGPEKALNFGFGVRSNLLKSNGQIPNLGLFVEVQFPDKNTTRYANSIYQGFAILIDQPLEKRIRLISNIGMTTINIPTFNYTLNLSVDISPIATIFVEHYGLYFQEYDGASNYYPNRPPKVYKTYYAKVNGGFAIRPIADLQIDVSSGYGRNLVGISDLKDWYVSAGISWRTRFKKRERKEKSEG